MVATILELIRHEIGAPIRVHSWVRCREHNTAVGGMKNSYHMAGMAADISAVGWSPAALRSVIERKFNGKKYRVLCTIAYGTFVHVDVRFMQ